MSAESVPGEIQKKQATDLVAYFLFVGWLDGWYSSNLVLLRAAYSAGSAGSAGSSAAGAGAAGSSTTIADSSATAAF